MTSESSESGEKRQAGGWHGGKVLPPRGKTAPVTGPAGRSEQRIGRSEQRIGRSEQRIGHDPPRRLAALASSPPRPPEENRHGWLGPVGLLAGLIALGWFAGWSWVVVVCALVVMVFLHEMGHFMAARWTGMKVTELFIGFGPRIWSFRRGETTYGVKALWLGAYVRIIGMNSLDEVDPAEESRSFRSQSYPRRMLVLVAGPGMHFVMALAVIFAVLMIDDRAFNHTSAASEHGDWTLATVSADSAAARAGLEPGDELVSVDGVGVSTFEQFGLLVQGLGGEEVDVAYRRDGIEHTAAVRMGERLTAEGAASIVGLIANDRILAVEGLEADGPPTYQELADFARSRPGRMINVAFIDARTGEPHVVEGAVVTGLVDPQRATTGFFGVSAGYQRRGAGLADSAWSSAQLVASITADIVATIPRAFTDGFNGAFDWLGDGAADRAAGGDTARALETRRLDGSTGDEYRIISIYGVARLGVSATESGLVEALEVLALVNIVLGLFNLLPLLPLDGGHAAVATYERIRSFGGRQHRVDAAKLLPVTYAVVALLLAITSVALVRDIIDPVNFG